jgi:hypothetical protein
VRGGWAKSRPRCPTDDPGRAKPMGAASGRHTKCVSACQGLSQGQKPRNRGPRGRQTASAASAIAGETVRGCFQAETPGYLAGGESSEGRIPRALPVRNKTGEGSKGESRHEGNQTLKAERSGQAKLASGGPSILNVLKGAEVHERCRTTAVDRLGAVDENSRRRPSSTRGFDLGD